MKKKDSGNCPVRSAHFAPSQVIQFKNRFTAVFAGSLAALAAYKAVNYLRDFYPFPPLPRSGKRKIACIGDSITFGAGVRDRKNDSYPTYLEKELGENFQVLNYGLSGRTLLSSGDRPYSRECFYKRSFTDHPDLYLVMLGTNDSKPYNWDERGFERELFTFLTRYIDVVGKDRVFVLKCPKAVPKEGTDLVVYDILEENIEKILPIIERTAARLGIQVIDLFQLTDGHPEWFADGVHPNEEGNRQIASFIAPFIQAVNW